MNNLPLIVWDVDDVLNNLMASWIDDWSYRNKKKYRINDLIENPPNRMLKISLEEYYNDSSIDYIELNMKKWNGLNYENGFFFLDDNARLLADEIAADLFI